MILLPGNKIFSVGCTEHFVDPHFESIFVPSDKILSLLAITFSTDSTMPNRYKCMQCHNQASGVIPLWRVLLWRALVWRVSLWRDSSSARFYMARFQFGAFLFGAFPIFVSTYDDTVSANASFARTI